MSDISIISLVLFVASGIFFATAIFMFIMSINCKQKSSKTNKERLTILNEVMLVHTSETIECQSQITDMKSE